MSNGTSTPIAVSAKVAATLNPATIGGFLEGVRALRDETAAWAAFRSKRFTVSFAVILAVLMVGILILGESVLLSIPFFALAAWVATSYQRWQAQVDIAQIRALSQVGAGSAQALQELED